MKYYCLIVISTIFFNFFILSQQNSCIKLSGKPLSSDSLKSSNVNDAFDGDLSTSFKSSNPSNGWIGLKLDSKYLVTKIGLAFPQDAKKEDYILGILEGSNDPNFYDSYPIYMITKDLELGKINYIDIKVNKRYKFIRYIGPNKSYSVISEFEIYGDDELETESNKENTNEEDYFYQITNLPLVVIKTENSVEPYDKENYVKCSVSIIKDNKVDTEANGKIKLRGNATLRLEKRSYRIKFNNKENPLGLPANAKSWTLLANHSDKTLIRNMLAFKISSLFEMKYTPICQPVDLIVNGEFKGNYGLCDQVEEGKGRIEVTEMDETSIEEPEITGGYVLAADQWAQMGGDSYYTSNKGVVYTIKYPKVIPKQEEYITNYFNLVEEECYNNSVDRIDLETFCKYLLIEDLCGNGETYWSTYMTKEREDDKIYFGPVWDFDISFDNDNRVYSVLDKKDFIFKYGTSAGTMNQLAINILSNKKTIEKLKEIWKKYSETTVTTETLIKYINDEVKNIEQSQKLNFKRWDVLNTKVLINPVVRGSFEKEVDFLKEYIQKRYVITDEIVKNASYESITAEVKKKEHKNDKKGERNKKNFHSFLIDEE